MKLSHLTLTFLMLFIFASTTTAQPSDSSNPAASQNKTKSKSFRPTKTQIKEAQEKLIASGTFTGTATGKYSNEFRSALRKYQASSGLPSTGKLTEQTLAKMNIPLTDSQKGIAPKKSSRRKSFRATRPQIRRAQEKLKSAGSFSGEISGKYSKDFRTAIREFQSASALRRSGSLNRATLEKLDIPLTDSQKAMPVDQNDFAKPKSAKKRGPVFRATKKQIIAVQNMLTEKQLYSGEATGKLNKDTRSAIRNWQKSNNIKVTGTLNKTTLEAMGIPLTERQQSM